MISVVSRVLIQYRMHTTMKYYLLPLYFTMSFFAQGQTIHLFTKAEGKHINLMASNLEYCPISIDLELDLDNMYSSQSEKGQFVIPAQSQEYKILELHPIDPYTTYKFGFSYSSNYGNHLEDSYDENYVYWLPFAPSASYPLDQGYHGRFSHQGILALDFSMPEGSPVHAARKESLSKWWTIKLNNAKIHPVLNSTTSSLFTTQMEASQNMSTWKEEEQW